MNEAAEYEAVRSGGAGIIDLSKRGRIEVSGSEAVQFLNGLVTNDVKALEDGAWMLSAFPNVQGRLIAFARVIRRGGAFLFDTESETHERVFKTLERFTLAGDFRVRDLTAETSLLSIQGARARELMRTLLGEDAASVERGRVAEKIWNSASLSIIRATHTAEDGFDLFINREDATSVWDALLEAGAHPFGFETLETLRIEAGQPRFGLDMDENTVVLETGLDEAVSFTKGCYIGQEIIARIHWRGHVAKRLAGLIFDGDEGKIEREARIKSTDGKEIGRITSPTFSPRLKKRIALGYVKYDYLAPGTEVRVVAGEAESAARVTELPFVRGSWYEQVKEAAE